MANIIYDIQPKQVILKSAYIQAPFDKGKELLEKEGYNIISLQQNAKLRIQEGKDAFVSQNGNWTREGVLYSKKGKFLTKNSPIMANAKEATDCHRKGPDFYLTSEQVEQSLADSVEISSKSIPTNRFAENKITVYAFGDIAEEYGNFLKQSGINEMPIWTADLQDEPFARQMWFGGLGNRSELGGYGRFLNYDDRVRGVCEDAIASEPNKISEAIRLYSKEQILNALKKGNISELETTLISLLEQ